MHNEKRRPGKFDICRQEGERKAVSNLPNGHVYMDGRAKSGSDSKGTNITESYDRKLRALIIMSSKDMTHRRSSIIIIKGTLTLLSVKAARFLSAFPAINTC